MFTLKDIKDGDEIEYRRNIKNKVVFCKGLNSFVHINGGRSISMYKEDLKHNNNSGYDIIKVTRDDEIVYIDEEFKEEQLVKLKNEVKKFEGIIESSHKKIAKYNYQINKLENM